jgi:hypothetical protein
MTTLGTFADRAAAFDPGQGRDAAPTPGPGWPGGLTLPVLALAALVSSPAIWQCLVRHTVPMHVMLERYVLIALGCLLVSEAVRRLLWPAVPATPAGGTLAGSDTAPDHTAQD